MLKDLRGIAEALDVGTACMSSSWVRRTDANEPRSELSLVRRKQEVARLTLSHKQGHAPRVVAGLMGPLAAFVRMGKAIRCGDPNEAQPFAPFPGRRRCKGSVVAGLELFFSEVNHGEWIRIYAVYELEKQFHVTLVGHAPNVQMLNVAQAIGGRTHREPKAIFMARDLLGINGVLGVDPAPYPAYQVAHSITPDGAATWLRLYREKKPSGYECVARLSLVHRTTEAQGDVTWVTHGIMGSLSGYLRLFSEIGLSCVAHRVQPNTLYPVRAA